MERITRWIQDWEVEKWMRDCKITDLYEGTGQINTLVVARHILGFSRKDLFVGMHLFSPANIMKLVGVTYTQDTSEETITLIEDLSKSMDKTSVRVKDVPGDTGSIANRVFGAAAREAMKIVEEGIASAEDMDTAMMLGFRWPVGPLSMGMGARAGWK